MNKTYKIKICDIIFDLLYIFTAIIIAKTSNIACAPIIRRGDLEKKAIPNIVIAIALDTINICFTCCSFHIMLYVNERIAIVLKYPLKASGKILKRYIEISRSNVIPISITNTDRNLKRNAKPKNKNVILKYFTPSYFVRSYISLVL